MASQVGTRRSYSDSQARQRLGSVTWTPSPTASDALAQRPRIRVALLDKETAHGQRAEQQPVVLVGPAPLDTVSKLSRGAEISVVVSYLAGAVD